MGLGNEPQLTRDQGGENAKVRGGRLGWTNSPVWMHGSGAFHTQLLNTQAWIGMDRHGEAWIGMHRYWTGIVKLTSLMCWCIICDKLCPADGAMPNDRWVRPTQLLLGPHGVHCVANRAPTLKYSCRPLASFSITTMSTIPICKS